MPCGYQHPRSHLPSLNLHDAPALLLLLRLIDEIRRPGARDGQNCDGANGRKAPIETRPSPGNRKSRPEAGRQIKHKAPRPVLARVRPASEPRLHPHSHSRMADIRLEAKARRPRPLVDFGWALPVESIFVTATFKGALRS